MRVFICRRGGNYKIYKEDKNNLLFNGHWLHTWKAGRQLELANLEGTVLLTIKMKNRKWFQWDWESVYSLMLLANNQEFEIKCIDYSQQYWCMTDLKSTIYDYYAHRGHLKSILKNNVQIAKVDRERFRWFQPDTVCIDLDKGEDPLLLAGLVLAFDMDGEYDDALTFSIGRFLGSQARKYDEAWRPK